MAFVFSPLAARLSERVPLRALIGVGLALAGVGLLVAGGLDANSEWTALLSGLLLTGAGIGLVNPTVAEAAIGVVPAAKAMTGAAMLKGEIDDVQNPRYELRRAARPQATRGRPPRAADPDSLSRARGAPAA